MVACAAVAARPLTALLAALALLGFAGPRPAAAQGRLVDRILAVVDEDPILASEVEQAIGLGLVERRAGEDDGASPPR
jgi:hypothetical protein